MLTKGKTEKYADVLIWALKTAKSKKLEKRAVVAVRFDLPALPLAEALHARLLDLGLNPVMRALGTPTMERDFYEKADRSQLVFIPPGEEELLRNLNGSIFLHAPASLTHLGRTDPKKIGKVAVARKPLRDILRRREEQGTYGWTLCAYPTDEMARHAGLTPGKYAAQVVRACYLDRKDPVSEWREVHRNAAAIKKWINSLGIRELHVESENIDLRLVPGEQRRWIGVSGHNIPSFEIFVSPDWRGTRGVYFADQPSFRSGNYVEGVRLVFRRGSAVKVSAAKGESFVEKQLAMDRGANRVGEFSLTDKRLSRINHFMANTLYDENFGGRYGNCHLAVGSSYSDTFLGDPKELDEAKKKALGFNDSALHWDLVNTEKKTVTAILADGKRMVIYENGRFRF